MSIGIMGMSAQFMQAGCAKKKAGGNTIKLIGVKEDPSIVELSCVGEILVESIKNGEQVIATYSDLTDTQVSIQADADTTVVINGDVTKYNSGQFQGWGYADLVCAKQLVFNNNVIESISGVSGVSSSGDTSVVESLDVRGCTALTNLTCGYCSGLTDLDLSKNTALTSLICNYCSGLTDLDLSNNTALTNLNCDGCSGLTDLDLSNNTALTNLTCGYCSGLTDLDLSKNTALTNLECGGLTGLTDLDLSKNTALTSLVCGSLTGLTSISYSATNSTVSNAIANAISDADAADGTVYTDSAAAYYSTIATAATTKGWTIEQIPA